MPLHCSFSQSKRKRAPSAGRGQALDGEGALPPSRGGGGAASPFPRPAVPGKAGPAWRSGEEGARRPARSSPAGEACPGRRGAAPACAGRAGGWRARAGAMMARWAAGRAQPCALVAAAALAVCAFYYAGSGGETFSSATRRLKETRSGPAAAEAPPSHAPPAEALGLAEGKAKEAERRLAGGEEAAEEELHLLLVLAKAERNAALRAKAEAALRSLVRLGKLEPRQALAFHLLTDAPSKALGKALLRDALRDAPFKYKVIFHDVSVLTEKLLPVVEAMQKLFSAGTGTYYSDSIFFLSVAMHRVMPREISRIIQVDLDVEYRTNIRELFEEFDNFPEGAVIGIAEEMQPVYRHIFWQYRQEHPGTKVGEPPPDGLPGFNSGVLLLNLEAMRQSALYNRLLEPEAVRRLAEKFHFKGHLGDQDFFTLAGMEHPELFHVLDCTWNRQLCSWWRDHGYSEVFDRYFQCDGHVKIYHGNCNTPIPAE